MPPKLKGDKGGSRAGSGRPSSVSKDDSPSRSKYLCPVCGTEKRTDKLLKHLYQLCIFDSDGKPLESNDERYITLSVEAKQHTEYCSRRGLKKDELPKCWKRLSPASQSLNPFERAKKKSPSEPLCQAMNFATDPNASTSESPPFNANSQISTSDAPDPPANATNYPINNAPNSPANDTPNSPANNAPNSPVIEDPNLPHADPPDPPDTNAIPTLDGHQSATFSNGEYRCKINYILSVHPPKVDQSVMHDFAPA